jgi:hypothetical protein
MTARDPHKQDLLPLGHGMYHLRGERNMRQRFDRTFDRFRAWLTSLTYFFEDHAEGW